MTFVSSAVVTDLVQYMRTKSGHSTVWRPVNNPISRRMDETRSVTSELVTQRRCSPLETASSGGVTALRGIGVLKSVYFSPAQQTPKLTLWHQPALSLQLLVNDSLSLQSFPSNSVHFPCALTDARGESGLEQRHKSTEVGESILSLEVVNEQETLLSKIIPFATLSTDQDIYKWPNRLAQHFNTSTLQQVEFGHIFKLPKFISKLEMCDVWTCD